MAHPNPDDGLMPDITELYRKDPAQFEQNAIAATQKHAVDQPEPAGSTEGCDPHTAEESPSTHFGEISAETSRPAEGSKPNAAPSQDDKDRDGIEGNDEGDYLEDEYEDEYHDDEEEVGASSKRQRNS